MKQSLTSVPLVALLLLAAGATIPTFAQAPAEGVERVTLRSQVLGEERTILVRTPAGYARGAERYPVLYMTDGDAHMLHTVATVQFLARNGRMPEMIVVGITNTDRTRDLTPTKSSATRPTDGRQQFPTSGGADNFLKFIETELIPQVEKNYRTQPFRVFAGHSFGGLFAVHAMLTRPELFQGVVAVSPSLQWDDQLLIKRAEEFFKARKGWKKTLFVTLGNEPGGIGAGYQKFTELLARTNLKGFDTAAQKMDDEDHGSVVLRSHYAGLRKIFNGWQVPRDPATGAVAGGFAGVEEHYKKLSQRYGYAIPVPEALLNQHGYQLLAAGRNDEAVNVFKRNVELYPESANVYDSLAEAYERTNRLDLARANYEKAYQVGGKHGDPNLAIYKANLDRVSAARSAEAGGGSK